ncbi:ABC transporter ATP-binding protein [Streptomyces sp. NPDC004647]|uniref:ABC transporter ATP-binding protein n=1 Tax=Streptomyces sp. NPDC004647 TaxID=3154671 RepID=UPI0033B6B61B
MIQAIGLTSAPRRSNPPAVDDLTFEARPGLVTVLLGAPGAGKTTALRLMLQLQPGRGVTLFRGRPVHRIPHPAREVGVMLGDVPGHPARSARSHLRMLAAAAGVPAERSEDVLELVGLRGLAEQRLGSFSRGMDRRLGLAAALIGDPHTLVLDEPAHGLSPREASSLYGLLHAHADEGGAVLVTASDPMEAARLGDRVVTLDEGRLVADQRAADFARTRLRPRVAVRSPHAARLAARLTDEKQANGPAVEVVREGGSRICVYGSSCAAVGETAFRNGILVHQLADEIGDMGPVPSLEGPDGGPPGPAASPDAPPGQSGTAAPPGRPRRAAAPASPESDAPIPQRAQPGPAWPLRYELRRAGGVWTGWLTAAAALAASFLASVLMALASDAPAARLLAGWPTELPLPPAAFGAGLLGALAFGQEFRYPALAHAHAPVPRRLGLLVAKLVVCTAVATVLAVLSVGVNAAALQLVFGGDTARLPADWPVAAMGWAALVIGCAWAGLLAAGLFCSTSMGLAAVLAVPVLVVPAVQTLLSSPAAHRLGGLPERLRSVAPLQWPSWVEDWIHGTLRLGTQPVGQALALSLFALLCAYMVAALRGRARWWS